MSMVGGARPPWRTARATRDRRRGRPSPAAPRARCPPCRRRLEGQTQRGIGELGSAWSFQGRGLSVVHETRGPSSRLSRPVPSLQMQSDETVVASHGPRRWPPRPCRGAAAARRRVAHRDATVDGRRHERRLDAAAHARVGVGAPELRGEQPARDAAEHGPRHRQLREPHDRRVDDVDRRRVPVAWMVRRSEDVDSGGVWLKSSLKPSHVV